MVRVERSRVGVVAMQFQASRSMSVSPNIEHVFSVATPVRMCTLNMGAGARTGDEKAAREGRCVTFFSLSFCMGCICMGVSHRACMLTHCGGCGNIPQPQDDAGSLQFMPPQSDAHSAHSQAVLHEQ